MGKYVYVVIWAFVVSWVACKSIIPILKKLKEERIQGTEMYEVLKDTDCLKKGQFVRLDKAKTAMTDPTFNTHAHIEVRADKKAKEPLFECFIDECGKFIIRGGK